MPSSHTLWSSKICVTEYWYCINYHLHENSTLKTRSDAAPCSRHFRYWCSVRIITIENQPFVLVAHVLHEPSSHTLWGPTICVTEYWYCINHHLHESGTLKARSDVAPGRRHVRWQGTVRIMTVENQPSVLDKPHFLAEHHHLLTIVNGIDSTTRTVRGRTWYFSSCGREYNVYVRNTHLVC